VKIMVFREIGPDLEKGLYCISQKGERWTMIGNRVCKKELALVRKVSFFLFSWYYVTSKTRMSRRGVPEMSVRGLNGQ